MKFFVKYKYPILILILLLAMYLINSTYALLPNIQKLLLIVIPVICIFLGVMEIRRIYKSYSLPLKLKNWIAIISFGIIIGLLIFFGYALSSFSSKADGIFTTYMHNYKFNNITFYTYETNFIGTYTHVWYREKKEWISHSIDNMSFSCSADSVHIEQKDTSFLMSSPKQKYIFFPKSKKVIVLPY